MAKKTTRKKSPARARAQIPESMRIPEGREIAKLTIGSPGCEVQVTTARGELNLLVKPRRPRSQDHVINLILTLKEHTVRYVIKGGNLVELKMEPHAK